ncbi:2-amino-4-hydroxy-6-hydroxymethyldihydropteridine diphosphokinase [Neptunicella marina]|uniref:2-amino-4-hydroxy-6-hydroxymethyldihydropteridine diphosphokinase n=1 Tax=Neptunicella marina TaxID=2125989 RepID=A0A8J6IQW9_9ALTE|nr:2-amino-4-hydroxy-6-hydroxymethyldihydropteridine diphosphokinase [Neptunicella marina]MBC3764839.1 2-amino-4-hydroxy-6-hydroxymethyldihydropteridine diphosphokinase [Neptunicella marina]
MSQIFISVGSNVEREKHINAGVAALHQHFSDIRLSTVYESEAVGFEGSHFYNLVVAANTQKDIAEVVALLKAIEDDNGRIRGDKKFAPRTLDLDLLLYDDAVCQSPVELPREEIKHNAFVLLPLSELAADLYHPETKQTYVKMWDELNSQQKLWPVNFEWKLL